MKFYRAINIRQTSDQPIGPNRGAIPDRIGWYGRGPDVFAAPKARSLFET
jgi:hypothetical protein